MNLYELAEDLMALQAMLEDPDADEQVVADTIEAVEGELEVKADGYAKMIRNLEGSIEAVKMEEKRLAAKRSVMESGIKKLKENLYNTMKVTGKVKFKTDLFSFTIAKNGGALPVVVDVSTEDLPDECVIIKEEPDKKALAAFLTDPKNKDYYSKFAHFGERGESLRIK